MNIRWMRAIMVCLLVMAAGCGKSEDVREIEPEHAPDTSLVSAFSQADLVYVATSPEELIETRERLGHPLKVIVSGAVESVSLGRNTFGSAKPEAGEEPTHHLVMQAHVSEMLRTGDPGEIHDERVYVELWQGPTRSDQAGRIVGMTYPLEDWQEAIPVGTKVMLFLHDFDQAKENGVATEHEGRGLPAGAKLLTPDPQGIVFEYDGKLIGFGPEGHDGAAWGDANSISDITARVTRHLDSN